MVAAACSEGPRAKTTGARLPRAYRQDMLHFALVAAASSAFFVALAILLRPVPSRSLAARVVLPAPPSGRVAARDARLAPAADAPQPSRVRRRTVAPAGYQTGAADMAADRSTPEQPARRRNVLSRFFRGMLGRPSPSVKADPVE